ncbi:MAG: FAD-dependent oxidoreductase [Lentisphaeria bacterium]|nr:FAD-dependent oxidoreductase [Lentisphaeria bacterium]
MIYDIAIIGGGITGAATAYHLSHFELKTVILEKESDCSFGVSKANSGIVHGGFHYSARNTLKGKLELRGNQLFDRWHKELDFAFERCGILVAAFTPSEMEEVEKLYASGVANGVPGIELCSPRRMLELEPKLNSSVCGGLFAPQGGVTEPYMLVFSLIDAVKLNGNDVKTDFKVTSATEHDGVWEIFSENGDTVKAKYVINAAGLFADEVSEIFGGEKFKITPRKGEEYLLDRLSAARPSKVIFPVPAAHSKGVLVIPTAGGTTMIGPTAQITDDKNDNSTTKISKDEIFSLAQNMVSGISERDLITSFSGSRPVIENKEDFFIAISKCAPNFIQAAGIQSPGLTASPAISEYIGELLVQCGLKLVTRKTPFILPEKIPHLRELSTVQLEKLYRQDPAWANIICRCEKISEAEIRIAVRRGHTTLDGVKFATRASMGRCQGGFCTMKIMQIIADESGIAFENIVKNKKNSAIIPTPQKKL